MIADPLRLLRLLRLFRPTSRENAEMGRSRKPTVDEIAARLMAVKLMVWGMSDAMPSLASEMRREACETLEDVIDDLAVMKVR